MRRHAVLLTFSDMKDTNFRALCARMSMPDPASGARKYDSFTAITFGPGDATRFADQVGKSAPADSLKVFVGGHGEIGRLALAGRRSDRTVEELTAVLAHGLSTRVRSWEDCERNEVCVLACLFGRTTDGRPDSSAAAALHEALRARNIFVTLVARTERMTPAALARPLCARWTPRCATDGLPRASAGEGALLEGRWTYVKGKR